MTFQEYLEIDALNWTSLKNIAPPGSPKRYRYRRKNPIPDTPRFGLGRAVHTLTLEPHEWDANYAVFPAERRGNIWKDFQLLHAGKTIMTQPELVLAKNMTAAVKEHPVAGPMFAASDGEAENVIVWTDPGTGILCKGRVDWSSAIAKCTADLKSARDASPKGFGRQAANLKYFCQIVWYHDGQNHARREKGLPTLDHVPTLVAVEVAPPHEVAVYYLTEEQIFLARDTIAELMAKLAECERTNQWPGIAPTAQPLLLPAWEYATDDGDVDELGLDLEGTEKAA